MIKKLVFLSAALVLICAVSHKPVYAQFSSGTTMQRMVDRLKVILASQKPGTVSQRNKNNPIKGIAATYSFTIESGDYMLRLSPSGNVYRITEITFDLFIPQIRIKGSTVNDQNRKDATMLWQRGREIKIYESLHTPATADPVYTFRM